MALFNRLFSSRKKNYKHQDTVRENLFIITKEQIRILLFRECDFRGRKLLFDSESVQKVALPTTIETSDYPPTEKYIEISNGYGYQYIKPCCDIGHLGEMVFGAVAMSYKGTSLKIHSLKSPSRLMCSQIFASPRHSSRGSHSRSSQSYNHNSITSFQSLEHSIRLDDSGTSSATSTSDRLSVHSNGSDALLVCRGPHSVPLDVPQPSVSTNHNSLVPNIMEDSGISGEQSYNSISSGPQSFPLCCPLHEGEQQSFSCGSLYKKWLRSTSTSLEHSSSSLAGSTSADECILRSHPRSSKLGLAIVIELPFGQEQNMELFLMEHASLIESMLWRARQSVEVAYIRHSSFVSLMCEAANNTAQWLIDLFAGPQLSNHMWISLAPVCDKFNSINNSDNRLKSTFSGRCNSLNHISDDSYNCNKEVCFTMSLKLLEDKYTDEQTFVKNRASASLNNIKSDISETVGKSSDFMFLNLTKFLRNEFSTIGVKNGYCCDDKNLLAEKCVTELCELLDCLDLKHTNFFVSTLLTAVLTHHLGWVSTVLPASLSDKEKVSKLHNPCNPLWGQLTDLYGAIGHPTKVSHTIITGTNKSELISKILNSLTYFIRCSDIERKCLTRLDIQEENKVVDCICKQKSCIPKENYKKYEDHLREMAITNGVSKQYKESRSDVNALKNEFNESSESIEMHNLNGLRHNSRRNGLVKTRTCITDLCDITKTNDSPPTRLYPKLEDLCCEEELSTNIEQAEPKSPHLLLDKVKSLGIQAVDVIPLDKDQEYQLTNAIINEKVRKLCRVPTSAVLYHMDTSSNSNLIDIHEASLQVKKVFAPKKIDMEKQTRSSESYHQTNAQNHDINANKKNVVFVLGDNEELIGIKKVDQMQNNTQTEYCTTNQKKGAPARPNSLNITKRFDSLPFTFQESRSSNNCQPLKGPSEDEVKPSTSWRDIDLHHTIMANYSSTSLKVDYGTLGQSGENSGAQLQKEFCRSKSVPPQTNKTENEISEGKSKYRYSGVKFNFQQYPQIVTNYMRSKNLELSQLPFSEKAMKLNSFGDYPEFDFSNCNTQMDDVEILQTPSNASELEFTSDLVTDSYEIQHAKEVTEQKFKTFVRHQVPNTIIKEPADGGFNSTKKVPVLDHPLQINEKANNAMFEHEQYNGSQEFIENEKLGKTKMQIIELPMPRSNPIEMDSVPTNYTSSLMRGIGERYISNMVLQGTSAPKSEWESTLRRDLSLTARHPPLDQPVDEAIAIVANTDTWEVQILSSHTYIVDRGSSGVRVGMSQLVANMLESLLQLWKLRTPPEYCIMHIEQKLQEFCILSKSLSELLLATEFCSMDLLTSVLQLEINDVPLLMAVASTHSPQLAQKYGLSFH